MLPWAVAVISALVPHPLRLVHYTPIGMNGREGNRPAMDDAELQRGLDQYRRRREDLRRRREEEDRRHEPTK